MSRRAPSWILSQQSNFQPSGIRPCLVGGVPHPPLYCKPRGHGGINLYNNLLIYCVYLMFSTCICNFQNCMNIFDIFLYFILYLTSKWTSTNVYLKMNFFMPEWSLWHGSNKVNRYSSLKRRTNRRCQNLGPDIVKRPFRTKVILLRF